jgi:endogenous inhibitor of DNA gyrase (YacG/DUF329 family)
MADTAAVCVHCRVRPVDLLWRPFCGERCKLLDLARWADGSYRVAGEAPSESEDRAGSDNSDDQGQK